MTESLIELAVVAILFLIMGVMVYFTNGWNGVQELAGEFIKELF